MNDIPNIPLTQEVAFALAGLIFSLFLRYVPKVNVWFEALDATYKALIVLVFTLSAPFVILGGSCLGLWSTSAACSRDGVLVAIRVALVMLTASQVGHNIFPKQGGTVAEAKNRRFAKQVSGVKLTKIVLGDISPTPPTPPTPPESL